LFFLLGLDEFLNFATCWINRGLFRNCDAKVEF
jgi:hypothetical protein